MFEIEFTVQAERDLRWFRKHEQNEILNAIETQLRNEPTVETRNRKRLHPNQTSELEMRVGKFRIFYDVDVVVRIVSVEAIGLKVGNRLFFQGREKKL